MISRKMVMQAALLAATLTGPALAQPLPPPNSALVTGVLQGLNAETRAEVDRRATAGNHPYEVLRIMLLNNMQLSNLIQPGQQPLSEVVAIDFVRETAVLRQGDNLRTVNFDRQTLRLKP